MVRLDDQALQGSDMIQVTVVHAPTGQPVWSQSLSLPKGATLQVALERSGFEIAFPEWDWRTMGLGVYGQLRDPASRLHDGDRIEIYRALVFDPKESRRRRAEHRRQLSITSKAKGAKHG